MLAYSFASNRVVPPCCSIVCLSQSSLLNIGPLRKSVGLLGQSNVFPQNVVRSRTSQAVYRGMGCRLVRFQKEKKAGSVSVRGRVFLTAQEFRCESRRWLVLITSQTWDSKLTPCIFLVRTALPLNWPCGVQRKILYTTCHRHGQHHHWGVSNIFTD